MTPACTCVGEWRLIERVDTDDGGRTLVFRWFVTWSNPGCSWAHEDARE